MRAITHEEYQAAVKAAGLKSKFIADLRPKVDNRTDWDERDFLAIADRSGNVGILWIDLEDGVHILPFELRRGIVDKATGRAKPVICDLCFTQQIGTNAARLTIRMPKKVGTTRGLLVCADLACSAHVRGKTLAGIKSKAQLRETMTIESKIARLQKHLTELVESL